MRRSILIAACVSSLTCLGANETNELGIAREALRDGLYSVALMHVATNTSDEARLIVLECFAREEKWAELLVRIDAMGYPSGDGFSYYRALALYKNGSVAQASNILSRVSMERGDYASSAARLGAELATAVGDKARALELLEKFGGSEIETKMMIAERTSDRKRALALWREVATDVKVREEVRSAAAVNLDDVALLRERFAAARSSDSRALLAARLGGLRLAEEDGFEEGEKMVLLAVKESPDVTGARDAFYRLAAAYLKRCDYAKCAETYNEALKIWPEASKDEVLHSGLGLAYVKLHREKDALEEFTRAEELAADEESRALEALRHADALVALERDNEATAEYQRVRDQYPKTKAASMVEDVIARREKESRGRQAYAEFRFDEAAEIFAEIAKEDPSSANRTELYLALCAYGAGREDEAERRMQDIAAGKKMSDEKLHATRWLARLAYNRGRWREAQRRFSEYAELSPSADDAPEALVWSARAALADNDFDQVVAIVAKVRRSYPNSPWCASAVLAQGEALIELGRFDDAVLVLDGSPQIAGVTDDVKMKSKLLRADAIFAMGADNPARYAVALDAYNAIRLGANLTPDEELTLAYKEAKTLEKLRRLDEAIDMYYTRVVLAYRTGRIAGTRYSDDSRAVFASSAMRLADEYERRGRIQQAMHVLELVRTSDVPAADEAAKRIERLMQKGR